MSDGSKGQLQTRYTKIRNLGSGSFGDVWLVRSNYSFRNYVVKEMNKQCNDEKERAMAVNEANILAQLKHKNIVRYKDAFFDCNRFCIVMEYADDGDLSTKIKKQKGRKFQSAQILDWFVQLVMAVKYIHDQKILHRDFLSTYVCVLFIEDFKYDVVHERHIERSAKAKANSPKPKKGELVKASGYCAKIFRIGTEEECLQELKRLEKALDVLENSDLQETNKEGVNDDDDDDSKVLEDSETEFEDDDLTMLPEDKEIAAEQKRVETLLKKRKLASMEKNKHTSCNHETEINKLKIQMSNMNEKISILMDLVKQKPKEVAVRTPLRKEEPSPGENSPKNCSPVIFNGIDLTSGHCPSKPNLFATQRLSVLFKNEEMETMTLDPSPKSGKGTLDPERISILFDALNAVYGEKKTAKWRESINKAIKQKCLDKLKIKHLKSQNVFLTMAGVLKVGDFGISRALCCTSEHAQTVVGTPYYLSPEICQRKPYNQKSDIWSLGVILYEMAMLTYPFTGKDLSELVSRILLGKYAQIESTVDPLIRDLILILLQVNPKDRPSAAEILCIPSFLVFAKKFVTKMKQSEVSARKDSFQSPRIERKRDKSFKYDVVFDLTVDDCDLKEDEKKSLFEENSNRIQRRREDFCKESVINTSVSSKEKRNHCARRQGSFSVNDDLKDASHAACEPGGFRQYQDTSERRFHQFQDCSFDAVSVVTVESKYCSDSQNIVGKKRNQNGPSYEGSKKPRIHEFDSLTHNHCEVEDLGSVTNFYELIQSSFCSEVGVNELKPQKRVSKVREEESQQNMEGLKAEVTRNIEKRKSLLGLKGMSPKMKVRLLENARRKNSFSDENCQRNCTRFSEQIQDNGASNNVKAVDVNLRSCKEIFSHENVQELPFEIESGENLRDVKTNREILVFIDDDEFYQMVASERVSNRNNDLTEKAYKIQSFNNMQCIQIDEIRNRMKLLQRTLETRFGAEKLRDICKYLKKERLALLDDHVHGHVQKVLGHEAERSLTMIFELLLLEKKLGKICHPANVVTFQKGN